MLFHFDELESLISKSKNNFQIIGIPETRIKKTQETTINIQLENLGLNIEHVPTDSANGGVLMYIKKAINYKLIPDLESIFIEIIQKDSKNMVVGCIYTYSCMQHSEFNDECLKPQWKQRSCSTWWFRYWLSKMWLKQKCFSLPWYHIFH